MNTGSCFTRYKASISNIELPDDFAFPFYYSPHPLAVIAAQELQHQIQTGSYSNHDFGLDKNSSDKALGKMFGVLVVTNRQNEIGYLSAFSGELNVNHADSLFVPSIYDRFNGQDTFAIESKQLDILSKQINKLEADQNLTIAREILDQKKKEYELKLYNEKIAIRSASKTRKLNRTQLKSVLETGAYQDLHKQHVQESINDNFKYKAYAEYVDTILQKYRSEYDLINNRIIELKSQRKLKSNKLQNWLFTQYNFLNSDGESKNVVDLFKERIPNTPPTGAGDCAAPKLFQYAFQHNLQPIALAEFWWGKPPNSKVRKHKNFYPACRGKCRPILNHMLAGIKVAPNPLLAYLSVAKQLKTVYEDDDLLVICKPSDFLSVPGKNITDSVQERMIKRYPNATGPMIVHRLDMSTSGLMIVAKSKIVHKALQEQFRKRRVTKRYIALLDGELERDSGFIDLPLRVDHDNRPYQMVCHEHGKPCRTRWEVIEKKDKLTKVYFYPLTGRTHQLRVHAAHRSGLGTPILGDDLYGIKKGRLYLHAETIAFEHPITKQLLEFDEEPDF